MPNPETEQDRLQTPSRFSRRHVVFRAASGASGLAVLTASGALAVRHDDKDDDRDEGGQDDKGGHDERDEGGHDENDDRDEGGQDDDTPAPGAAELPAGSIEVQIVDDDEHGFSPGSVEIEIGQSITFVNLDDDAHTATGSNWDTGIMQPGDSVSITFDEPGSFAYACQIHPVMTGTVTVGDSGLASPEASPAATPVGATPASGSESAGVTIQEFAFGPLVVNIAAGTTISWTNNDQAPHTATSLDGTFDTGTIEPGQTATVTFDAAGSYDYQCAFHPNMTGTVVVT